MNQTSEAIETSETSETNETMPTIDWQPDESATPPKWTILDASKEYEKLLDTAFSIQDACNLSAVIRSYNRALDIMWRITRETPNVWLGDLNFDNRALLANGTAWVNSCAVSILYAEKINLLASGSYSTTSGARPHIDRAYWLGALARANEYLEFNFPDNLNAQLQGQPEPMESKTH